jgi:hypothetical protein
MPRGSRFLELGDYSDAKTPAMCDTLDGKELCAKSKCTCGALHIIDPMLVAHNGELVMLLRCGFIILLHLDTNGRPVAQSKLRRLENVVTRLDKDCWEFYTLTTVSRPVLDLDFGIGFVEDFLARIALANNEEYRGRYLATTPDAKLFDDFINQRGWWGAVFFPLLTKIFKEVCDMGDESIYDKLARLIHNNLDGGTLDAFLSEFAEMTLENWREYQEERQQPWFLESDKYYHNNLSFRGSFSE